MSRRRRDAHEHETWAQQFMRDRIKHDVFRTVYPIPRKTDVGSAITAIRRRLRAQSLAPMRVAYNRKRRGWRR